MLAKPFPQSYWVHERLLCAGHYPGDREPSKRDEKLQGLVDCGIRRVLSLMESGETSYGGVPFDPYAERLQALAAAQGSSVECRQLSIRDGGAPNRERMLEILRLLSEAVERGIPTYFHCWGGHGRTSTVCACHLIQCGATPMAAFEKIAQFRRHLPKNHYPFEEDQEAFIRAWSVAG